MGKPDNNKFKNNDVSDGGNNVPVHDPKIVSVDSLKEQYNKEMMSVMGPDSVLQLAKITADVLTDEFKNNCSISWRETDGNYWLYVTQTGIAKKALGQILVTVRKDHTYNVRLNPYTKYDKKYFLAENMDTKQLIKEMPTMMGFLANEQVPSGSAFKEENYTRTR